MKLHIGSGRKKIPGWTSVDIRADVGADIVADARDIPVEKRSVGRIYACHVLEHFPQQEVVGVLRYWYSLLVPRGTLYLAVPSFFGLMYAYEGSGDLSAILPALFGGQNYEQNYHYTTFDYRLLTEYLLAAGFAEGGFWDHGIPPSRIGHQVEHDHTKPPSVLMLPAGYYDYSMLTIKGILCSLNVWGRKA